MIIGRTLDKLVFEHTVVIGMHMVFFLQPSHQALLRWFPAGSIVCRSGRGDFENLDFGHSQGSGFHCRPNTPTTCTVSSMFRPDQSVVDTPGQLEFGIDASVTITAISVVCLLDFAFWKRSGT